MSVRWCLHTLRSMCSVGACAGSSGWRWADSRPFPGMRLMSQLIIKLIKALIKTLISTPESVCR